jgi:hypothetical protein
LAVGIIKFWNIALGECDQYYLDTRFSFRHTLPAKKVLFKLQNLQDKALKLTTKARNFKKGG